MAKRKAAPDTHSQALPEPTEPPRPKRVGAGKGGVAQQLEKCAEAITHASKRPRKDGIEVPSSEPVNPMAPQIAQRKRRQRKDTQPKRSDAAVRSVVIVSIFSLTHTYLAGIDNTI